MNNTETLNLRRLRPDELEWANLRYAEVDFVPSSPGDYVAVAEINGVAAGLGRVVPLTKEMGELGGIYVFPERRGGGVSRAIIAHLIGAAGQAGLVCLPFGELRSLYESAGFRELAGLDQLPSQVLQKYRWCNEHYAKPVLLMYRPAKAAG